MTRYGIIDLGTNTFHLLIVEQTGGVAFRELYRERRFIKLAEDGLEKIGPQAFRRGLRAMIDYRYILEEYEVKYIRALGTAALRTASNGDQFMARVKKETLLHIDLISGQEEARLIHLGVTLSVPLGLEKGLIMDIGGGSVEFIIADAGEVYWARSFPVGLAVLFNTYHKSDPINSNELVAIDQFLTQQLQPLTAALERYPVKFLIGAAGAFEVLEDMLSKRTYAQSNALIDRMDFHSFFRKTLPTTCQERIQMPKLPTSRADMFIVALLLIDFALDRSGVQEIVISEYALKEGVLYEQMQNSI